jgi:hypothetical protein
MDEQKQQAKEAVTTAVKEEAKQKVTDLASGLLGKKTSSDSTKTDSTTTEKPVVKDAVNKIQNLLKKKKGN